MTKEEILSKSQKENAGRDVAGVETARSGIQIGWIVTVTLAAVISVLDGVLFGRPAVELLFAVMAGLSAVFLYKYGRLGNRHELFIGLIYGVAAVCFLVVWVVQIFQR